MKHTFQWIFIVIFLFSQACKHAETDNSQDAESIQPDSANRVEISQAQIKTAGIVVGGLKSDTLSSIVEANGHIELLPNSKATINPPINGFIAEINCMEGEPVKKGSVLFILKHPDIIELQKDYIQTSNDLYIAQQEVDRQKVLSDANVSAQKQYEQAQADFQTANAQKNAVSEQLLFVGINPDDVENGKIRNTIAIVAPFDGIVSKVFSNKGQLVGTEETVMEIINADRLLLKLNVFEQNVNEVKANQKINFTVPSFNNDEIYNADVSFVGKTIDTDTRTIQVTSILHNYPELIPGLYAEAKILCNPRLTDVLPNEAIVKDADGEFVFMVESESKDMDDTDEMTFQKIQVTTGDSENGYTEIVNAGSFPVNSMFVTKGAYYLKSEMNKGEADDD